MEVTITPSVVSGKLRAINSKSHIHRLLICAALSSNTSSIYCPNISDDIEATARCLCALGATISRESFCYNVVPIRRDYRNSLLNCNESGSTLRFLLPVAAALGTDVKIYMSGRLPDRPLAPLTEQLSLHGCRITHETRNIIQCVGQLESGEYTLPGDLSSQFISGLLFALPILPGTSVINIQGELTSSGYIRMTLDALQAAGITIIAEDERFIIPGNQEYHVLPLLAGEGDWSNSAFWLTMGAISDKSVTCSGLYHPSSQKDKRIVRLLRRFGAQVTTTHNSVTASKGDLHGILINAADIPDLVPALSVVAAAAKGVTAITHVERLRAKESDRLETTASFLTALGADIKIRRDRLIINGTGTLTGGAVDSFGDHRIAMAAACASIICSSPVTISNAQAVRKSYPGFWDDFERIGGKIERSDSN